MRDRLSSVYPNHQRDEVNPWQWPRFVEAYQPLGGRSPNVTGPLTVESEGL